MGRSGWLTLAVALNAIFATLSHAQTNSCISTTDGFWDEARIWSLGKPPSIKQSAILITNAASETITIDSTTAHDFKSTLTISNLSVDAESGGTDTLYLDNTGTIALHIFNDLAIGIDLDSQSPGEGVLISTNSTLVVDGLMGGQLEDDGTIVIVDSSLITTNCSLQVAPESDTFSLPVGLLVVSNSVVQARDVAVGTASVPESSGTIEVIGGTMTVSSTLIVGDSNGEGDGGSGNLLLANQGLLVVTNDYTGIIHGSITVVNASFLGAGIFVGGGKSGGELTIDDGTVTLDGELNVGTGDLSDGSVNLNGGMLVVTNDTINLGGFSSSAPFTVSDGIFLGQSILLQGGGRLFIQGGKSILSSTLGVYFLSAFSISGGQLIVTNALIYISAGTQQSIVSGGLLNANYIEIGGQFAEGQLSVDGGSVTVSTGITLGDCASDGIGYVTVDGGKLIVTNDAGTGFIDLQNGQLVLSAGRLHIDKLVMTNSCGSFIHTGGKLIVGSVVLDPNAFAITSIAREGDDLRVTWMMGPGQTNALQASSGGKHGAYTGKGFDDIFVVTNNTTAGTLTNYLDIGAATNKPSRYYRARLAP